MIVDDDAVKQRVLEFAATHAEFQTYELLREVKRGGLGLSFAAASRVIQLLIHEGRLEHFNKPHGSRLLPVLRLRSIEINGTDP